MKPLPAVSALRSRLREAGIPMRYATEAVRAVREDCRHSFRGDGKFHVALAKTGFGLFQRLEICRLADAALRGRR